MKNIKNFEEFLLEYVTINQGANLASKERIEGDDIKFDGGDGPSAEPTDIKTFQTVKNVKKKSGNTAKIEQERRKKKQKKIIKSYKDIAKGIQLNHSSEFGNNGQGNSPGGGGADYTLQGF